MFLVRKSDRIQRVICAAILALLLANCRPTPTPTPTIPAPTSSTTPSPGPSQTPTSAVTITPSETPTPSISPTPLTSPAVLNRYPLESGNQGESIAAGGGRVWVGTTFGTIEEHDSATGGLLKTYTLVPGSADNPAPVRSLVFDGQHLWALAAHTSSENNRITQLFVLDNNGQVLKTFDLSDLDPRTLGSAPGQVWTQGQVFDTTNLEETPVDMSLVSSVFAYDGAGWVWAGGGENTCDSCPTHIYRFATSNPGAGTPGPAASQNVLAMAAAGNRMWALTAFQKLDGYDLGNTSIAENTTPVSSADLSAQVQMPAGMLYDGHSLWVLAGAGTGGGMLYQRDPTSGQDQGTLPVGDATGTLDQPARVPVGMAFDGHDLWVLTAVDLVRVGLPWAK